MKRSDLPDCEVPTDKVKERADKEVGDLSNDLAKDELHARESAPT